MKFIGIIQTVFILSTLLNACGEESSQSVKSESPIFQKAENGAKTGDLSLEDEALVDADQECDRPARFTFRYVEPKPCETADLEDSKPVE